MKSQKMICCIVFLFVLAQNIFAGRLLTVEKALKQMFPDADEIKSEVITLEPETIQTLKTSLGGSLVHFQKGSESETVNEALEYTFYYGIKDGKKTGVAVVEEQPGKWGPVEFMILLDAENAKVKDIEVLAYQEKRGRPIARKNFLGQFVGKSSDDPIEVRKDIRAISGATISSDATCFAVKKVIAMYELLVLHKSVAVRL